MHSACFSEKDGLQFLDRSLEGQLAGLWKHLLLFSGGTEAQNLGIIK